MEKILIIGQAPPAVKQKIPYDTTLLYEMLSWINISKEKAQELFEFEAMSDKFPGYGVSGHLTPSTESVMHHWNSVLKQKVENADKIILLGKFACDWFYHLNQNSKDKKVINLVHPSKRNTGIIMRTKAQITHQLQSLHIH